MSRIDFRVAGKKRQGERERSPCHGGGALWRNAAAKLPIFIGSI
jgi:hypothetical protein